VAADGEPLVSVPVQDLESAEGASAGVPGALSATAVVKQFAGLRALDGVMLKISRGDIVGLIGPNGSGKTTMINLLSGVLRATSGRIEVDGVDVSDWPPHRRAGAGICRTFQDIRLFGGLSVVENVEAAASATRRSSGERPDEKAIRLVEEMGIAPLARRRAATLAYGAQRRVEIARALATEPKYLLLDEPAAGMNEAESDALHDSILAVHRSSGTGLLVVDHDLRLIMRLCQRVVVLNEGQVIAEGTPSEVEGTEAVAAAYLGRRARARKPEGARTAGLAKKEQHDG
jgi:ABC-type branched-subunit amino acid transport system ATPase component